VAGDIPQQIIYEKALRHHNSVAIFQNVMGNAKVTSEAKIFAARGLWEKSIRKNNN